jgi:hypothetical protein
MRHLGGEGDIRVGVGGWEVEGRHHCLRTGLDWRKRYDSGQSRNS